MLIGSGLDVCVDSFESAAGLTELRSAMGLVLHYIHGQHQLTRNGVSRSGVRVGVWSVRTFRCSYE